MSYYWKPLEEAETLNQEFHTGEFASFSNRHRQSMSHRAPVTLYWFYCHHLSVQSSLFLAIYSLTGFVFLVQSMS
jgi:hypothetical protein